MTPEALAAIQARADAAGKHSADLCTGKQQWTMSIPPRIDHDSDFLFGAVIDDVKTLLEALRESEVDNARLRAALVAAREAVDEWGGYAMPYFQEKWDLAADIAAIDAALAVPSAEGYLVSLPESGINPMTGGL